MKIIRISTPVANSCSVVGWVGDEFIAVRQWPDLSIYRVSKEDRSQVELISREPDINCVAVCKSAVATIDEAGRLSMWRLDNRQFSRAEQYGPFEDPIDEIASYIPPYDMRLSGDGRYLIVESEDFPSADRQYGARVILLDTRSGEIKASIPYWSASVRADFARAPTGHDVVFVSAESEMGIQMIDCETGAVLNSFDPGNSNQFCHTNYQLMSGGDRLWVFVCWWACPFEALLYDCSSWMSHGHRVTEAFPFPRLYEDLGGPGSSLSLQPSPEADTIIFASYCDARYSEHLLSGPMDGEERKRRLAIRELLRTHQGVLVANLVDCKTGQKQETTIVPVQATRTEHIHQLPSNRIVLAHQFVEIVDVISGSVEQVPNSTMPVGSFRSCPSPDGTALVVTS